MKPDTIQQLYLELLAAWGEHPLDEEAVKEALHDWTKLIVRNTKKLIEEE